MFNTAHNINLLLNTVGHHQILQKLKIHEYNHNNLFLDQLYTKLSSLTYDL